jgi:hypothetical protein
MAAFTIIRADAYTTGAKFAAVVFTVFGHHSAQTKLAIAVVISTGLFRHGNYLLHARRGSNHASSAAPEDWLNCSICKKKAEGLERR